MDECQGWADKAEAMASYARQAKDETLRRHADRIQARAIRRCGELLKQVQPASGARTDLEPNVGVVTRSKAASDAGLSERQKVTALRAASIPEQEFHDAVEAEVPSTVTQLAERGKQTRLVRAGIEVFDISA